MDQSHFGMMELEVKSLVKKRKPVITSSDVGKRIKFTQDVELVEHISMVEATT